MDQKLDETDQQIENFKVFVKSGNGLKIIGNGSKIRGNRPKIRVNRPCKDKKKQTKNKRKPIKNKKKPTKNKRKPAKNKRKKTKDNKETIQLQIWETDRKYSEIPQQFGSFQGFSQISKKRKFL